MSARPTSRRSSATSCTRSASTPLRAGHHPVLRRAPRPRRGRRAAQVSQRQCTTGADASTRPQAPPAEHRTVPRRSRRISATIVGVLLLFVIVVGATVLVLNVTSADEVATTDAARGAQAAAPDDRRTDTSEEAAGDSRILDIPQGSAPDGLTMKLEFTGEVWVRVLVDGQNELEGVMRPGAVSQFTADRRIDLRIGVAEAVTFLPEWCLPRHHRQRPSWCGRRGLHRGQELSRRQRGLTARGRACGHVERGTHRPCRLHRPSGRSTPRT